MKPDAWGLVAEPDRGADTGAPWRPAGPASGWLFGHPFLAGFECSTHRRRDGVRLDVARGARHDAFAATDYALAFAHGMRTARDGLRWHLIETAPGLYDWSSWTPMVEAADATGIRVIWDLWHYGTPDDIDIWSDSFVDRLVNFARAAARRHQTLSDRPPLWCPLNEMSFFAFIAGEVGDFHPYGLQRGHELKRQLVRAGVQVARALREVDPRCRLLWAEPLIHIAPVTLGEIDVRAARDANLTQYQAFDMIAGRMDAELGGSPDLLDIVGCNFYPHNQWRQHGATLPLGHHDYRPLSDMLHETWARYGRPVIVAETGAEGSARAPWLHYVCQEVAEAREAGADIGGICLYPVTSYPGWDDDRPCSTGLFGAVDGMGRRGLYRPLVEELARQTDRLS
ncbi:beta-glucosidase [soil metagenome]